MGCTISAFLRVMAYGSSNAQKFPWSSREVSASLTLRFRLLECWRQGTGTAMCLGCTLGNCPVLVIFFTREAICFRMSRRGYIRLWGVHLNGRLSTDTPRHNICPEFPRLTSALHMALDVFEFGTIYGACKYVGRIIADICVRTKPRRRVMLFLSRATTDSYVCHMTLPTHYVCRHMTLRTHMFSANSNVIHVHGLRGQAAYGTEFENITPRTHIQHT